MNDETALDQAADRLIRRSDRYWEKYQATGEQRFADIAAHTDRMWLLVKGARLTRDAG